MPESRREKPTRFDFLDSAEFEEKVDKYASVRLYSQKLDKMLKFRELGKFGIINQN